MQVWDRSHTTIRINVLLLSLLTISPVIAFLIYLNISHLNRSREIETAHLTNLSKLIATEYAQINEGARQLLISLSISPQVAARDTCHIYLANLLDKYQRYSNFSLTNAAGQVICSGVASDTQI